MNNIPEKIQKLVKEHLGKEAIKIQQIHGRGAWIVVGELAHFVPAAGLPKLYGGGSTQDFQQLLDMVQEFDLNSEVVVLFNTSENLQVAGIMDAF